MAILELLSDIQPKEEELLIETLENERSTREEDYSSAKGLGAISAFLGTAGIAGAVATPGNLANFLSAGLGGFAVISGVQGTSEYLNSRGIGMINEDLGDTYSFEEDVNLSGLLEASERVDFKDHQFSQDDHGLYEFTENESIGLYNALMDEPEDITQHLTVKEAGEGHRYLLDIGINGELAGRFEGYATEDIEEYLEEGEPVVS